jgi:hypothetical protein
VEYPDYLPQVTEAKTFVAYLWLHLIFLMLMIEVVRAAAYLNPFISASKFCSYLCQFISKNVREEGVNRKTVRFFDTLGESQILSTTQWLNFIFFQTLYNTFVLNTQQESNKHTL